MVAYDGLLLQVQMPSAYQLPQAYPVFCYQENRRFTPLIPHPRVRGLLFLSASLFKIVGSSSSMDGGVFLKLKSTTALIGDFVSHGVPGPNLTKRTWHPYNL